MTFAIQCVNIIASHSSDLEKYKTVSPDGVAMSNTEPIAYYYVCSTRIHV